MRGGRFDPDPSKAYGRCKTCAIELPTPDDSRRHMADSRQVSGGRSHTVWIANPDRPTRIRMEADRIVDDAIQEAVERLDDLVMAGHITNEEVTTALAWHSDFQDAWREFIEEDET